MNLKTGILQWEPPIESSDSQPSSAGALILQTPGQHQSSQTPHAATTITGDIDRYSLALDDITLKVTAERASDMTRPPPNFAITYPQHSDAVPKIGLTEVSRVPMSESSHANPSTPSHDRLGAPQEGKKKNSFLAKLRRKSGGFT